MCLAQIALGEMDVLARHVERGVSQNFLQTKHISACADELHSKGVAEGVRSALGGFRVHGSGNFPDPLRERRNVNRMPRVGEEDLSILRTCCEPLLVNVCPQCSLRARTEWHAALACLAAYADKVLRPVDAVQSQAVRLADADARVEQEKNKSVVAATLPAVLGFLEHRPNVLAAEDRDFPLFALRFGKFRHREFREITPVVKPMTNDAQSFVVSLQSVRTKMPPCYEPLADRVFGEFLELDDFRVFQKEPHVLFVKTDGALGTPAILVLRDEFCEGFLYGHKDPFPQSKVPQTGAAKLPGKLSHFWELKLKRPEREFSRPGRCFGAEEGT
jgi:hypothetical protein